MERIGGEVKQSLRRLGPQAEVGELTAAWPGAVGEAIARNAWPLRLARDRTLHVATTSSAWAYELAQLAPDLLERLRGSLGRKAPSGLRFTVGRLPEPGPEPTSTEAPTRPEPGPEERRLAEALVADIGNEELRSLVARAAAASLARAGDDRSF